MATFNTRIQNRIDTWANWIAVNPTPLNGEICIATVPAETGAVKQEPAVLIKIGDGEKDFKTLPILTAKAGNVSDWALADSKPSYNAGEIGGIDAYIASYVNEQMGITVDTDTQYQLVKVDDYNYKLQSKGKTDAAWADVAGSSFVIPKYDDTALAGRVTAAEGELTTLKGEGAGSIAKMISDAIAALDLANTYAPKTHGHEMSEVNGLVDALDGKQAAGDYATKAEAQGYANAKDEAIAAAQKAGDDAQDAVDALAGKVGTVPADKTVVQMIADAQTAATYDDTAVKGRLDAIEADYLVEADKTELQGNIDKKADQTALDGVAGRVTTVEGDVATLKGNAETVGSVDYKIAQAVALIIENPDEAKNSINELVTWCNDHAEDALELSNQVSANKEDIADLAALIGNLPEGAVSTDVVGYIGEAIAALSIGDYAKAADLTAAVERVAALEGKMTTVEGKVAAIEGDYLKGADKTALEGKISEAQAAAEQKATDLNGAMDTRVKAIEDDYLKAADKQELADDIAEVDGKFASYSTTEQMNAAIKVVDDKFASYSTTEQMNAAIKVVDDKFANYSTTEQMNAAIKVEADRAVEAEGALSGRLDTLEAIDHTLYAKDADLHAVAKSGNPNDMVLPAGEFIVFACGNASGWDAQA